MRLIDYSVRDFINQLDSASPAPGGGSSAAVGGAMGIALMRMVGHLTIPKKKFKALDEQSQETFIEMHESLRDLKRRTMEIVDEDTEAFNAIMKAFKMPKTTEEEKYVRQNAIENATHKATQVPLELCDIAHRVLKKFNTLITHGNKNAISDIGVATLMMYSALEGAALNVKINVTSLKDESYVNEVLNKVNAALEDSRVIKEDILTRVHDAL